MFRRLFATLMMLGFFSMIVGCNTIAGAGKDVEEGGKAVKETAKDVQKKM